MPYISILRLKAGVILDAVSSVGLRLWNRFIGNVDDSSGSGNNGILNNGRAVTFNGTTSILHLNPSELMSNWTLVLWVNSSSFSSNSASIFYGESRVVGTFLHCFYLNQYSSDNLSTISDGDILVYNGPDWDGSAFVECSLDPIYGGTIAGASYIPDNVPYCNGIGYSAIDTIQNTGFSWNSGGSCWDNIGVISQPTTTSKGLASVMINNIGQMRWQIGSVFHTSNTIMNVDTWYRIAYSFDGSSYSMWINGVLDSTWVLSPDGSDIDYTTAYVEYIGGLVGNTQLINQFDGSMSNIQIWNKSFEQTDIEYDYNNPDASPFDICKNSNVLSIINNMRWYSCNENKGDIIYSGNSMLGVELINNGAFISGTSGWVGSGITWDFATQTANVLFSGSNSFSHAISYIAGNSYEVSFTARSSVDGKTITIKDSADNNSSLYSTQVLSVVDNTYTFNWESSAISDSILFEEGGIITSTWDFIIDNVTVKELVSPGTPIPYSGVLTDCVWSSGLEHIDQVTFKGYNDFVLFDGSSYIDISETAVLLNNQNQLTFAFMVKANNSNSTLPYTIISGGNWLTINEQTPFKIGINMNNGAIQYKYNISSVEIGSGYNDGLFHHIIITHDVGSINVYVDGVYVATETTNPIIGVNIKTMKIGNAFNNLSYIEYFHGYINSVSIFKSVFTQSHVDELYNNGSIISSSSHSDNANLISYWNNTNTDIWLDSSISAKIGNAYTFSGVTLTESANRHIDSFGSLITNVPGPFIHCANGGVLTNNNSVNINGELTIDCWVKLGDIHNSPYIISGSPNVTGYHDLDIVNNMYGTTSNNTFNYYSFDVGYSIVYRINANNGTGNIMFRWGDTQNTTTLLQYTNTAIKINPNAVILSEADINMWVYITVSASIGIDGTGFVKMYRNGVLMDTTTISSTDNTDSMQLISVNNHIGIGTHQEPPGFNPIMALYHDNHTDFRGDIGAIRIHDMILSDSDILSNYNLTATIYN